MATINGLPVPYGSEPAEQLEAQHLLHHQKAFTLAFHNARSLGRSMLEELERMDEARRELERQGIFTQIRFQPELQAAYASLRRLLYAEDLDVPDFLMQERD